MPYSPPGRAPIARSLSGENSIIMPETPASIQRAKAAVAACFDSALRKHREGEDSFRVVGSYAAGMDQVLADLFEQ